VPLVESPQLGRARLVVTGSNRILTMKSPPSCTWRWLRVLFPISSSSRLRTLTADHCRPGGRAPDPG